MSVFGVGYSVQSNSYQCGYEAAGRALEQIGLSRDEIHCCFLFCTSRHNPAEFQNGIKEVIGDSRYIGGFTNGISTNDYVGYDGFQGIVGLLKTEDVIIDMFLEEGVAFNEGNVGKAIGKQLANAGVSTEDSMLLFFDAVNRQKKYFQMNYGTPFLDGMREEVNNLPRVAGARFLGDMGFRPTYQWYEQEIVQNSASAIVFRGNIQMDVEVMHGCTPASAYHTITKSEGATILEINDIPALEFLEQLFGSDLMQDYQQLKFFVTVGRNMGDKWAKFKADSYVNRMCVGIDTKKGGIKMAEIDITPGTDIQFMRRGYEMDYVEKQTTELIDKVVASQRKPIFALYLNCAGRAAMYSENTEEDAYYVAKAIDERFPFLGIYEAGELAVIRNRLEVLDWTGVFCLFSESA